MLKQSIDKYSEITLTHKKEKWDHQSTNTNQETQN